jgi:cell wall assembly regulator SMI1
MAVKISQSFPSIQIVDIEKVERDYNIRLPQDYRDFLLEHNGGVPQPDTFDLLLAGKPSSSDVRRFLGIGGASQDSLETQRKLDTNHVMPDSLLPIAYDSGGSVICLSVREADYGKVYFWDNQDVDLSDPYRNVYYVANSFTEFLNSLYHFDLAEWERKNAPQNP